MYSAFASFLMVLSLGSVLGESSALKSDVQAAQVELVQVFMKSDYSYSRINFDQNERKLIDQGWKVCAGQRYIDLSQLATDLVKARWLGPIASMFDAAWTATTTEPESKGCLFYYLELRKTKPIFFTDFERQNPWILVRFPSTKSPN